MTEAVPTDASTAEHGSSGLAAPSTLTVAQSGALGGLAVVAALAWLHFLREPPMADAPGSLAAWLAAFVMWTIMMAAMMLPTAAPVLVAYAATQRRAGRGSGTAIVAFAAGYLLAWTGFAAAATTAQQALGVASCESAGFVETSPRLAGAILLAVGAYQWTPLKSVCLRQCQSPIGFLLTHWRNGRLGAARMGLRHGLACVGCCWALMALMFVGGVMSLVWMAGLTVLVLAEKLGVLTPGRSRALGAALVAAGVFVGAGR